MVGRRRGRLIGASAIASVVLQVLFPAAVPADTSPGPVPGSLPFSSARAATALPSSTSLAPVVNIVGHVSVSVDGLATNNPAGGAVNVQKSPGATVRQALLLAASTGGTVYVPVDGDVTIDGAPVAWDPAHTIPTSIGSYNVLADVTAMVRSKLDAAPSGTIAFTVAEPNNTLLVDGEILAVIFDDPTVTIDKSITLLYGAQSTSGDTFNVALAQPVNKSDPNQQLGFGLGISYGYQAPGVLNQYSVIDVNGIHLSSSAGGQDDCDQKYAASPNFASCVNGALLTVGGLGDSTSNPPDPNATPQSTCVPRCDDELYNLEPFVNNGDTSFTIHSVNPSNDDNIFFAWLLANPPATVVVGNCSPASAPAITNVTPFNGGAAVSWQPVTPVSGCAITNYVVTATPTYNDRRPMPSVGTISIVCPADVRCTSPTSATFTNLLMDCHQRYAISVYAEDGALVGPPATTDSFRPSGILVPSGSPPYVVILLDGVAESQPGFTVNPYQPTLDGNPSYCPESWNSASGSEQEADFAGTPNGPWSFFHKWNVGEVDNPLVGISNGQPSDKNPDGTTPNTESLPRAVKGNSQGLDPGTYTHSFMLDALAAQGAIILPFSYKGFGFSSNFQSQPGFTFYEYSRCQSLPGCGPTVQQDASLLESEVNVASQVWPLSQIVVMGHSQGGLIAYEWWMCAQSSQSLDKVRNKVCHGLHTSLSANLLRAYSLDSPINGACKETPVISFGCGGPPSYPPYGQRDTYDPPVISVDMAQGNPFRFIGSYGDSPADGYQSGAKTLEHQLLFDYNTYSASRIETLCADPNHESGCPIAPPDHLSECPVDQTLSWQTAHYVEKYCPGDVSFFNQGLFLPY